MVNCFRLFVARLHADRDLALVSDIVIGRQLSHELLFSQAIEVWMFESVKSCEPVSRIHLQQLFEKIESFR